VPQGRYGNGIRGAGLPRTSDRHLHRPGPRGKTSEAEWEEIEDAARTITRAGWWIDQRYSEPGDLTELLQAATETDRPTENPHF
jgi:hypothetical protein